MNVIGKQFIDGKRVASSEKTFTSYDAATGEPLPFTFYQATETDIAAVTAAAMSAYHEYQQMTLEVRANFLNSIADEIDALGDDFVQVVMRETGLPEMRIRGERARTTGQLRLFATVVLRGDFFGARINTALPDRKPLPRADIRQYKIGVGPVAVFGASNFPLAFSVAGGDTASAFAAGCPVVVKAHSGHSVTAELVGQAIIAAAEKCEMPNGIFGMVFGGRVGGDLVKAPEIKAVGFTGSLGGGRALCDMAAARSEPIPVFAEMSSINPVILMPGALAERSEQIAQELADSVNLGVGQFCTSPGLIIGFKGEAFDTFCQQFSKYMINREPAVMLNSATLESYLDGVQRMQNTGGVEELVSGPTQENRAQSCAFKAETSLLTDPEKPLEEEVFGPCTVMVVVDDLQQLEELAPALNGHLTASLLTADSDLENCREIISALEKRVGRLILNDYPTGVEVCDAMVHGGPYPATSDSRGTSVGTLAIDRFLRPVCYQGYPEQMLPDALKNANPLGLRRLVDGQWFDGVL